MKNDPVIEELKILQQEVASADNQGLAPALRIGELLTAKRKEIPARKGWRAFLKTAGFSVGSSWRYTGLWEYRAICSTVEHIGLGEAYKLVAAEKRKAKPPRKSKAKSTTLINGQAITILECSTPGMFVARLYLNKVERKIFDLAMNDQAPGPESETAWTKLRLLLRKRTNKKAAA